LSDKSFGFLFVCVFVIRKLKMLDTN